MDAIQSRHGDEKAVQQASMTEGHLKMQIAGVFDLLIVNQDPPLNKESVLQAIENISARIALKPESGRTRLPNGQMTVSKLAHWLYENQLSWPSQ